MVKSQFQRQIKGEKMQEENQVLSDTLDVSDINLEKQPEVVEVDPVKQPEQVQESSQERNFKAMREINARLERERDEALRLAESFKGYAQKTQPQEEEENDPSIGNDELVEGKHLSKYDKKIKKLEQQLQNYQQQSQSQLIENKLRGEYPDFEKIVSKSNIDILKELHPHIAATLNSSNDLYSKAVSAYTLIKSLGIHVDDTFQADRELAQKNAAKPRPLTSVSPQQGDSPLSKANAFANGLTPELQKQMLKEMSEARRGY